MLKALHLPLPLALPLDLPLPLALVVVTVQACLLGPADSTSQLLFMTTAAAFPVLVWDGSRI